MMEPIWTNLDVGNLHSVNTPPDRSGLSRPQRLGITAGRRAGSVAEMEAALQANGLVEGTQDWTDAVRCGREAMRLTREKTEKTAPTVMVRPSLYVLGKDDQFEEVWYELPAKDCTLPDTDCGSDGPGRHLRSNRRRSAFHRPGSSSGWASS